MTKQRQPYGTWSSPVSAWLVANGTRLNDVQWAGETLVWHQGRGAKGVLSAQQGANAAYDLTTELSVRGGVGYGGGEFTTTADAVYFVANGRIYRQALATESDRPTTSARAITPAFGAASAPAVSPDGRWVAFVHTYEGADCLAVVDSAGKTWSRKLYDQSDFVMQPVWSVDSRQLAFVTWDHPAMPWDSTVLHLLTLDEHAQPVNDAIIAQDAAIFQPAFSPDGSTLSYISDATDWSQLYFYDLATQTHTQITHAAAEHGTPAWIQGLRMYAWAHHERAIYYLRNEAATVSVWRWAEGEHHPVEALQAYTYGAQLALSPVDDTLALVVSASQVSPRIISYHPARGVRTHVYAMQDAIPASAYAQAQAITWTGHDGEAVHGLYYPPTNERFTADETSAPPLIVQIHGGPSSQVYRSYEAELQFYATRGFAVLAVNHRGSSGYGRAYLQRLYGNWGYYDVEDAVSGAQHLAAQGLADANKAVILGGSAGGYTVLQSLVSKPGVFKAGICKYGISNQFLLVQDTHKFEAHYSYSLLGNLPESAALFRERSPIFHVDRIQDALIVFQGEVDTVVPRNQSDLLVESLQSRGIPNEYHVFEGEGHGFRKPETLQAYLKATLQFLLQHVVYQA